jgi:hypothetical protein
MDLTCRCKRDYTCVACRIKRGDYKDWILVVEERLRDGSHTAEETRTHWREMQRIYQAKRPA